MTNQYIRSQDAFGKEITPPTPCILGESGRNQNQKEEMNNILKRGINNRTSSKDTT